jgi:hypothetical protein
MQGNDKLTFSLSIVTIILLAIFKHAIFADVMDHA